jgi:glycosyltransferase involved in cell wall biosynthesis
MDFWIKGNEKLAKKSYAVCNGLDVSQKQNTSQNEIASIRKDYFKVGENELVIALIGRINSWKGQQLLLEAFHKIAHKYENIKLVFIGSAPPNQEVFEIQLLNKVTDYVLTDRVVIIPFQEEIWRFWDSIDIAVVPSTEPEPFGMVAIEAMLSKKPVIAANHGGLTEIVLPNETGLLFEPNNANALANALESIIVNPEKRQLFGGNGYNRTVNHFSLQKHVEKFEDIFQKI